MDINKITKEIEGLIKEAEILHKKRTEDRSNSDKFLFEFINFDYIK